VAQGQFLKGRDFSKVDTDTKTIHLSIGGDNGMTMRLH
jgi:hypothetical protein